GDFARDIEIYRFICLVATVLAIAGLAVLLDYSVIGALAALVVFTSWFQPLLSDVRVSNVNQIQLALLALFLWTRSKQKLPMKNLLSGLVLGFEIALKPNLIFVLATLSLSWVISRRFRETLLTYTGILIAFLSSIVFSSAAFGSTRCWIDWHKLLLKAADYGFEVNLHNYAPSMLIFEMTGVKSSTYLTVGLLSVTATVLWIARRDVKGALPETNESKRNPGRYLFEDMLAVATGCLIYLLSATLVWLHYFLFTIPMALLVLRPAGAFRTKKTHELAVQRLLAIVSVLLIAEYPIRRLFSVTDARWSALLLIAGTLTLFGLGMWEIAGLRRWE
ncbi:MAG: hypothetical protein HY801_16725, partial [Candidatus Lindowbacteria bacterium]|nr:hypothetical protein [Candidatus Lindowbacteria bacterium]